jgi:uncharacterized protein YsxB (DUF464 family)
MIVIQIYREDNSFSKLFIYGHSGKKGLSLPCAALSYLIQSFSSFLTIKDKNISNDDGKIYKINLKKLKEFSNDLYEYLIFSLELIARDYPKDIKLEFLEENNGT